MRILRKLGLLVGALFIIALIFIAGLYIGINLPSESKLVGILNMKPATPLPSEVDFAPFWQAWNVTENKFVGINKIKRQDMVYGAISGLLKSLNDPYTVFFPPDENKEFQSSIKGSFEGVGMEIGLRKNIITVIAPLKGTPAEHAGILAGDKIIRIGATSTQDYSVEDAVRQIRGPQGTKVKLTILRNGDDEPRVIEIVRDVINIPIVNTDKSQLVGEGEKKLQIPNDIFVLQLNSFSENSPEKFRSALREMAQGGQQKLILDLRNNPGGYLEAAVQIASWFLPEDKVVVQEDYGNGDKRAHRSYGNNIFNNLPMVILVNQGSASASEILAGALQDYGIAKLVGEKTFGKGSVQEVVPLTENTALKVTVAKWLTPKDRIIAEIGLSPDYEVKATAKDIEEKRDVVLERAIELLKNASGRLQ